MAYFAAAVERKTQITRLLRVRPRTVVEVADAIGLTKEVARKYLTEIRGERAHITKWVMVKNNRFGRLEALWAAGPGDDAPRPLVDSSSPPSNRRLAVARADQLARELRDLPADNPLQALVTATLHADGP